MTFISVTSFTGCSKALSDTKRNPSSGWPDCWNKELEHLRTSSITAHHWHVVTSRGPHNGMGWRVQDVYEGGHGVFCVYVLEHRSRNMQKPQSTSILIESSLRVDWTQERSNANNWPWILKSKMYVSVVLVSFICERDLGNGFCWLVTL